MATSGRSGSGWISSVRPLSPGDRRCPLPEPLLWSSWPPIIQDFTITPIGFGASRSRRSRAPTRVGSPVPEAPYSDAEHALWRDIVQALAPLHLSKAARCLREPGGIALPRDRLPQLEEVNLALQARTGFRMEPVEGLVAPRDFLAHLGRRVFLSTQYIRHASRPAYTPEPDVVHELVGHARSLGDERIAALNIAFGKAAEAARNEGEVERIIRVYWWTLEFGVVREDGSLRALGAGLLSSLHELSTFDGGPRLLPWSLSAMADTPYDPTGPQDHLFVAPSLSTLMRDLGAWLSPGALR